ncbi:MAG TPA: tRNA (adenosine(37)-N6)-dimethylallyltransferase MiaA [Paludibacteraceae bacterium]|nr:tRNA (adenosine(37)-N6)-dimethylallyltransferase MiaA [Paludibacteraceae bacterium]HRS67772.1 tRNA (adenosine(37)-N6)-dimethylallyltransferase MiaA [Paludibacteraceae bacterium]
MKYNIITILGPTATGKTQLATALAARIKGEIISADSRQIYRGMDIGTGKDLSDYMVDGKLIPYHLIDIVDAGYKYNLFEYQRDFLKAFELITNRGHMPILCGGTGLYIEAVLNGYKLLAVPNNQLLRDQLATKTLKELTSILSQYKTLHNKTDVDTVKRAIRAIEIEEYYQTHAEEAVNYPTLKPLIIGVGLNREARRDKITKRLKARLEEGMIDEVTMLLEKGIHPNDLIYYGLEYKFVTNYLLGKLTYDELFSQLEIAIHQFAKRQMTWFRGMERRGFTICWIDALKSMDAKLAEIELLLKE